MLEMVHSTSTGSKKFSNKGQSKFELPVLMLLPGPEDRLLIAIYYNYNKQTKFHTTITTFNYIYFLITYRFCSKVRVKNNNKYKKLINPLGMGGWVHLMR